MRIRNNSVSRTGAKNMSANHAMSAEKTAMKVSLDDKYALDTTRAYMTGIEALVRLPILQQCVNSR